MKQFKKNRSLLGFISLIILILGYLSFQIYLILSWPIAGWSLFLIGYSLNFLTFLYQQKASRTNSSSKISWAIFLLFTPFIGSFLFFISAYVPKIHTKHIKDSILLEHELFVEKSFNDPSSYNPLFKSNLNLQNKPLTIHSDIKIFSNGQDKIIKLIEDLENAKEFINIEYFILNSGIILEKIKKILIKKHKEGVKVRILSDYVGNVKTPTNSYNDLIKNGISFHLYNKVILPFTTGFANFRNHNKVVVIDNKIAYFGGMNIGDDYVHLYPRFGYWNDLHFRVEGEFVIQLNRQFILDWFKVTKEKISSEFDESNSIKTNNVIPMQLFNDGPLKKETLFLDNLIYLINNAKKSIKIMSPYIILPPVLEEALNSAKKRNVQIQIITAGLADKKIPYFLGKFYVEKMRGKDIEVYRMENIFSHSKFYLFDNEVAIIGTSNLDYRAIYYHWESNILVQSSKFANELNSIFIECLKNSYLEETTFSDWGITKKITYYFVKFFSPIF